MLYVIYGTYFIQVQATDENIRTYREVDAPGFGVLHSLGAEVFGRWSTQAVSLLVGLARERSRGMHPRLCRSTALGLQHRWAGNLAIGLQRGVAHIVANNFGADLVRTQLEPAICLADLASI